LNSLKDKIQSKLEKAISFFTFLVLSLWVMVLFYHDPDSKKSFQKLT
jgi:hypothetical protein